MPALEKHEAHSRSSRRYEPGVRSRARRLQFEATDTEPEAASTADLAGQTVQLLTHDSFALSDDVIADFEASTGVTLELVSGGDAGSMVAGAIPGRRSAHRRRHLRGG